MFAHPEQEKKPKNLERELEAQKSFTAGVLKVLVEVKAHLTGKAPRPKELEDPTREAEGEILKSVADVRKEGMTKA